MTTHPRARAFQAGAFLALIGGSLVVAPTPALAEAPSVVITSFSPSSLKGGERATLKFRVTNTNPLVLGGPAQTVTVAVSVSPSELRCEGDCSASEPIAAKRSQDYTVTLVAGTLPSGTVKDGKVIITASLDGKPTSASRSVTVRGDDKPPTAKQVTGRLKGSDGKAIGGADVVLVDSEGHQYDTTSNGSGSYRFFSSDQQPISPGNVTVGARKDGYELKSGNANVAANQAVKIDLTMISTATPSPSPSPSPSASSSATPSADASKASEPAEDGTTAPAAAAPQQPITPVADSDSDNSSSLLFLILGGLLVAAGIGAFVLVLLRRKDSGSDTAEPDAPRPGPAVPAQSRSGPDVTRVAGAGGTRVGGVGPHPAEATMVTSAPLPPSLSDAPTMLQQAVPVEDEFPDPYGAPAVVQHAGYQPARPPAPPARPAAQPIRPPAQPVRPAAVPVAPPVPYAQPGGYGAHPYAAAPEPAVGPTMAAGYESRQQRYDEPTGMYNPQAGAYHPEEEYARPPVAGYAPQDGYDQAGPYDDAGYAHPGHDQPGYDQSGYDQPGYDQSGYDQPGYDQPGYDQAEYPHAGGFGQAGYPGGAEHSQDPGYDQAGYAPAGTHAAPRPTPGHPTSPRPTPGRSTPGRPAAGNPAPGRHVPANGYAEPGAYPQAGPGGYPQQSPAAVPYQPSGYPEQSPQYTAAWSPGADDDNAYAAPTTGYAPDGYDGPTDYDPHAGYDHADSYGRTPEQQADPHHGYDETGGYPDQAGQPAVPQPSGRHGAAAVPPQQAGAAPGQRRINWLDD